MTMVNRTVARLLLAAAILSALLPLVACVTGNVIDSWNGTIPAMETQDAQGARMAPFTICVNGCSQRQGTDEGCYEACSEDLSQGGQ
jgi:hypothetical protein